MRILLSDGSGLTSRQTATQLAASGHAVEVLASGRLALTRFTSHVAKMHRVPPYGSDPLRWLDAVVDVLKKRRFDILLPTQEQVAVLSRYPKRITALGVALAVPSFDALAQVQDKVAALKTLARIGVPVPDSYIAATPHELLRSARFPMFVKTPIGTATIGVQRVDTMTALLSLADQLAADGIFDHGGVVAQQLVDGPLAMIQAVYARGSLLASHANLRLREGANGGASSKRSIDLPAVRTHLAILGEALSWHGALALDAILTPQGPCYIDVNPRLVEPGNAWLAGVDLVNVLLRVSLGDPPAPLPPGQANVCTHQLLLAILAAAMQNRRAVLQELFDAFRHAGFYSGSREELTPLKGDWRTWMPAAIAAGATIISPGTWRRFTAGAVANYALTPQGWRSILASTDDRLQYGGHE
jgi:hypothetical protein